MMNVDSERSPTTLNTKCMVFFTMACILSWAIPDYRFVLSRWNQVYFRPVAQRFLFASGLWQNWGMFIETSQKWSETTLRLEVQRPNGAINQYLFPNIQSMSYWNAFLNQRMRKFVETSMIPGFFRNYSNEGICNYYKRNPLKTGPVKKLKIFSDLKLIELVDEKFKFTKFSNLVAICP